MECNEVAQLATLLRQNGDEILNAASKLLLSTSLLQKLNESFDSYTQIETMSSTFHVIDYSNKNITDEPNIDIQFLHDIVQKTVALKLVPDSHMYTTPSTTCQKIDINRFKMLKLLELQKVNVQSVYGLEKLKSQLEYVICVRGVHSLKEFLSDCNENANGNRGTIWKELREAIFQHNNIENLDSSLEFVPRLHTLDLSHNRIRNAQALECLPNLKYLNLGFNQLETIPIFNTRLCDRLRILVLRNNYLEDIAGLFVLTNLCELDVSSNCLMEHNILTPLTRLKTLLHLNLRGNPLSYHPKHRMLTCPYLHETIASVGFTLDRTPLKKSEQLLVGKVHPMHLPAQASSLSSSTSETTVIASPDRQNCTYNHTEFIQTSDMEVSTNSNISADVPNVRERDEYITVLHDCVGMQDSGFVASARPISPSECSIENSSVETSLPARVCVAAEIHCIPRSISNTRYSIMTIASENDDTAGDMYTRKCESDIEVISNPSQSSIEVLDSGLSNRIIPVIQESTNRIQTPKSENIIQITSDLNIVKEPL